MARNISLLLLLLTAETFCWQTFGGVAWEPGFQDEKPLIIAGDTLSKGSRKQPYSFGFHASHWNVVRKNVPLFYGVEEGLRITENGAELFVHAQTSVLLKYWVVGAGLGPVFKTVSRNSVDVELNFWTGSIVLLNVRFPAIVPFPGNTTSNFPLFGLVLTLPLGISEL